MIWDWMYGLLGGLMIGTAAALLLLGNGRIMGASGLLAGLMHYADPVIWRERAAFVAGLVGVPALIVLWVTPQADTYLTDNTLRILGAGLLVGLGTRLGTGCTSGHGVCGMSRLSRRSIAATLTFIAAGVLTVALLTWIGAAP